MMIRGIKGAICIDSWAWF